MPDVIGILGLALAVFDELLTIGEKTAAVIKEIRAYDADVDELDKDLSNELWRTRTMRGLLVTNNAVYGGQTLLEQFDSDAQLQIQSTLRELPGTLRLVQILMQDLRRVDVGLAIKLKWSLSTKKDALKVLRQFSRLNDRLLEKIRLFLYTSQIGLDLRHLQRLQNDPNLQRLGLSNDAALKLVTNSLVDMAKITNHDLGSDWTAFLARSRRIEPRFSVLERDGKQLVQEDCFDIQLQGGPLNNVTRQRINALAELLQQPKDRLFCILPCLGFAYDQGPERLSYLFEAPQGTSHQPISLFKLLQDTTNEPRLEVKYSIASNLAQSVARLHTVGWVHESIRSENILFFSSNGNIIDWSKPWLFGFEFARPQSHEAFSNQRRALNPQHDVYRHPNRQREPLIAFQKVHDMYSLGVVLLELGLWKQAISLEANGYSKASAWDIQEHLRTKAQKQLGRFIGTKYSDVVSKCLTSSFGVGQNAKDDVYLQRAFQIEAVEVLRRIAEII